MLTIECDQATGKENFFNPDYALDHELHELTQIKIIKYIRSDLDENLFQGMFAILLIFLGFIRVIRGLMHYLGLIWILQETNGISGTGSIPASVHLAYQGVSFLTPFLK